MRKLIFLVAVLITTLPLKLFSQSQFNRAYDHDTSLADWGWSVYVESDTIKILSAIWPFGFNQSSFIFSNFDLSGNLISYKVIDTIDNGRYYVGLSNCVKKISNGYVSAGSTQKPPLILMMDC